MTTENLDRLWSTPELRNYFDAIDLHVQVHNNPTLLTSSSSTQFTVVDPSVPGTSTESSSGALSIQVDDAQVEVRLVSEMMEQVRLIEQALLNFGEQNDPKKIELSEDVQKSFNGLWSENLTVIIKAIEFLKTICKDVHRYWPYLEGQIDRLVMACARVIGLMFTRYKSSLFVNAHDATRAPIINLLNSTAQLFHSIIRKSPLLPSKISSETYSALLSSLIPYYLLNKDETRNLNPQVQSKMQTFTDNMFCMRVLNNLLLALLQTINANLVEYNQDPTQHEGKMNILIKLIENLDCNLSESKLSNLNLDLILYEADMLIRAYPSSAYEISRDFRLLEAIREIVFKIVEYKNDPGIWDHLAMIDLDQGDSGLIKYINIALERQQLSKASINFIKQQKSHSKKYLINDPIENLHDYKPIVPEGLKLSKHEDNGDLEPELVMFHQWLNNLANTSDVLQAKLCLDYLNQNFDDLVSKFAESLEPMMDLLIRACTRQYHLFTTLYYPPNVAFASCQSMQMLHSTTSLLKRIFTSTISLSSATLQTMFHSILLIFSLRLSWTSDISLDGLIQLESSILTNESLDKSALICICIRILKNIYKLPLNAFRDIQRFVQRMLAELTVPLQFVTPSMLSEQYDLNLILNEINEYVLTSNRYTLQIGFDRFIQKLNYSKPTEDSGPLLSIEQLIYDIVRLSGHSIYDNLNSLSINVNFRLDRFIEDLVSLCSKPNYVDYSNKYNVASNSTVENDKEPILISNEKMQNVTKKLDEIQSTILPGFRSPNAALNQNLRWFAEKLEEMNRFYNLFIKHSAVIFTAIETLTEVCINAMNYLKNYIIHSDVERTDRTLIYGRIGDLLLKMYGNSDSLGHEYVTMNSLKELVQTNIWMLLQHGNRHKELLPHHFQWIWVVQYELINHSKPYYLLPVALESFHSFLMEVFDEDSVERTTQENYLLVHLFTTMLEISCDQLFLNPTAIYTPQISKDKFDVGSFLKQVDYLFNYYPISYLEVERDYKILVLIRRVLHRLYEHHGSRIREFWSNFSEEYIIQSPVCAFFEKLIAQNGESELNSKFEVAESPTKIQTMQVQNDHVKLTSTLVPIDLDEQNDDYEEDEEEEIDNKKIRLK